MATGTFAHLGFALDGPLSPEQDMDSALGPVSLSPITIDFTDDDVLTPGETTTATFSLFTGSGSTPIEMDITFLGTDDDGSVHFDINSVTAGGEPVPAYLAVIFNDLSDARITNADPFPATAFPEVQSSGSLPVCFAAGTRIATPQGDCAVEALAIGDTLLTHDGGVTTVKWIGRQTVAKRFALPERASPVRVLAGAFASGVPSCDLTVTPDHAFLLDGALIHASALVNGTTVSRVPLTDLPELATYYHVETKAHEIVLANGTPAETFVDNTARALFDNYAEYLALYGAPEGDIAPCPLPRALGPRQVPGSVRDRLQARAADLLDLKQTA